MAWIALTVAGLFEVVWAFSMKQSEGFTRLWPSVVTIAAMIVSFALLAWSMRVLPLGRLAWCLNASIKPHTWITSRQDAEGLQNTPYHVGKPRSHADKLSSGPKERSRLMSLERLDVHCPVPARSHHLRQAFCIVVVRLVQSHLQR